jgi:hypothetical protein
MDATNPCASFSEKIVYRTDLKLGGLGRAPVGDLVSETLGIEPSECAALSSFIYQRAGGNPFYIQQQIICLREKNLLRFEEKWVWDDIDIMEKSGILDTDVTSMLVEKIERLPLLTQQVLKVRHTYPELIAYSLCYCLLHLYSSHLEFFLSDRYALALALKLIYIYLVC